MSEQQMVASLDFQGSRVWLKTYGKGKRRYRLALLDRAARLFHVPALRPPPHHGGARARAVEQRRLKELSACGALVPQVLGVGERSLLISDVGSTLAAHLGQLAPAQRGEWVQKAADALAKVHQHGGYIGQPLARNLSVDAQGRVGFLDLEEDPREVMPLQQAQVRDWLIFASGVSRYFAHPEQELGAVLKTALANVAAPVRNEVGVAVQRLKLVEKISSRLGRRALRIAGAIRALRTATTVALLALCLLAGLGVDLAFDGELDILQHLDAVMS